MAMRSYIPHTELCQSIYEEADAMTYRKAPVCRCKLTGYEQLTHHVPRCPNLLSRDGKRDHQEVIDAVQIDASAEAAQRPVLKRKNDKSPCH